MNSTRSSVMCQVMLVSTERHGHGRGSGLPVPMGGGGRWHLRTLAASSWAAGGAADCGHGELCPLLSLICFLEWLGGREAAAVGGAGWEKGMGWCMWRPHPHTTLLFQGILSGTV